jgi:hypothetical protein
MGRLLAAPINMRTRLFFVTDAVDNYFSRPVDRGDFKIFQLVGDEHTEVESLCWAVPGVRQGDR